MNIQAKLDVVDHPRAVVRRRKGGRRVIRGRRALVVAARRSGVIASGVIAAIGAVGVGDASGANTSFSATSGYFDVSGNWTNGIPGTGDNAYVDGGQTVQVGGGPSGSTTYNSANVYVGNSAIGIFQQSSGLFVDAGNLVLGNTVNGTGDVYLSGTATFNGANYTSVGLASGTLNTLNVSGSAIFNLPGTNAAGALNIADRTGTAGVLNLTGGAVNVTRLAIGNAGTATGYVFQTGGALTTSGTGVPNFQLGGNSSSGTSAVGIYNLSNGTLKTGGPMTVGAYGSGELNIISGTAQATTASILIGSLSSTSYGVLDLSGGTLNQTAASGTTSYVGVGVIGSGILNVRGTGALTVGSNNVANGLAIGGASGQYGIVNLQSGGRITASSVSTLGGTSILNFNGGTLAAGTVGNASTGFTLLSGLTNAFVYSGGATIDTTNGNSLVTQPLLAPAANGVSGSFTVTAGTGTYLTAPIVQITDPSGFGATAVASLSGGNIVITLLNAGYGYTNPQIKLIGGLTPGSGSAATAAATISAAAPAAGLLYKTGANALTLRPATGNTYAGTVVSAGTLVAGNANALPSLSSLNIAGGATVNFNAQYLTAAGGTPSLTLSSLIANGAATFGFNASSAGIDSFVFSSQSAVTGTNAIQIVAPVGATIPTGNYTLFSDPQGGLGTNTFTVSPYISAGSLRYPVTPVVTTDNAYVVNVGAGIIAQLFYTGGPAGGTAVTNLSNNNAYSDVPDGSDVATAAPTSATDVFFTASNPANVNNYTPTTSSAAFFANSLDFNSPSSTTITVSGSNAITLSASQNTFAAGTGIVLDANSGAGVVIQAPLVLATSQAYVNNSATYALNLSGGVALGGNTLTFSGTGSFIDNGGITGNGATNVAGGTVILNTATSPLGSSSNLLQVGGTSATAFGQLDVNGLSITQAQLNLSGGRLVDSQGGTRTAPTGSGTLTLTAGGGAGAAIVIAPPATAAYAGTLNVPAVSVPKVNLPNGGYVVKPVTLGSPVVSSAITLGDPSSPTTATTTTIVLENTSTLAPDLALTGNISGPGGLTLNDNPGTAGGITLASPTDAGTLGLSGNNSYTGGTNISYGRVVITNGSALGGANGGPVTIAGAVGSSGGTLQLGATNYTAANSPLFIADSTAITSIVLPNALFLGGGTTGTYKSAIVNTIGTNTFTGHVTLTQATVGIQVNPGTSLTIANVIDQSPGVSAGLTLATNAGTLILAAADTFTGAITISSGPTLQLGTGVTGGDGSVSGTSGIANSGKLVFKPFDAPVSASYPISGTGSVTVSGPNKVSFTSSNSYSGGTTITGGTVRAESAISSLGTGTTNVSSGGVLAGGTGTQASTGGPVVINSGGTITAGSGATTSDSIGNLSTGSQTWSTGGTYVAKLDASNITNDQLIVSGLNASSGFTVNIVGANALSAGPTYILAVDTTGTPGSSFNVGALTLQVNGSTAPASFGLFDVSDTTGLGGDDLVLSTAAPEPASLVLAGFAAAPLVLGRRRRR